MKTLIATIALLLIATTANAQEYRRPILAAFALPGPPFTEVEAPHRTRLPRIVATATLVASFVPGPTGLIGSGVPIVIRVAHVVANGSPVSERPLLWAASPWGHRVATKQRLLR